MNLAAYEQLLNLFPEKPSLKSLENNQRVPDNWPLILKRVLNKSERVVMFEVYDLDSTVLCEVKEPEMITKVVSLDEGQIIFLYDSTLKANNVRQMFEIKVNAIYTLKEVNDGLPKPKNPRTIRIKKPVDKYDNVLKNESKPPKQKVKKNEYGSNWRTLSERWKNQGKT